MGARELAGDKDGLYAIVRPIPQGGGFDAEVADAAGNCYLRLTGYRTVAAPNALDQERVKTLRAAMSPEHLAAA